MFSYKRNKARTFCQLLVSFLSIWRARVLSGLVRMQVWPIKATGMHHI
jgi:hypothetical protein